MSNRNDSRLPRGAGRQQPALTRRDVLLRGAGLASLGIAGACAHSMRLEAVDSPKRKPLASSALDVDGMARLIEDTPSGLVFESVAGSLRAGTPEPVLGGALLLAGVRNVDARENSFDIHCVSALHAARVLGSALPPEERMLPWFWALDRFKLAQSDAIAHGGAGRRPWSGATSSPEQVAADLDAAAEAGDADKFAAAVVASWRARSSAPGAFEPLWAHFARNRDTFGHKAIYAATVYRTLDLIGPERTEPALLSLTATLFDRCDRTADETRGWVENFESARRLSTELPRGWDGAAVSAPGTRALVAAIASGDASSACDHAARGLRDGSIRAQDAWDAVHLTAGGIVMKHPRIDVVHSATSSNALHFAFRTSGVPRTRLFLLLQSVAWTAEFARVHRDRGPATDILDLRGTPPAADDAEAAAEILGSVTADRPRAASLAFALAERSPDIGGFARAASRVVVQKATNPHEYKFPVAVFEDCANVSPAWRPYLVGAATSYLRSSRAPDAAVVERARDALGGV